MVLPKAMACPKRATQNSARGETKGMEETLRERTVEGWDGKKRENQHLPNSTTWRGVKGAGESGWVVGLGPEVGRGGSQHWTQACQEARAEKLWREGERVKS